jgi:hypothetical protein
MVLELAKVQSALHDARKAVIRSHHESSERHRMAVAAREIVAELARLKFALRESEAQCTALSSRLKQLEERAEHRKVDVVNMLANTSAAEERAAAAATVAAIAEAGLAASEVTLEAEKQQAVSSLARLQTQLLESEKQVSLTQAQLEATIEESDSRTLRLSVLPAARNWEVKATTAANYCADEVHALVEVLESRPWRAEDISRALAVACLFGTAEPIYLQVFDQREFWDLRTGWMRSVHTELETEGKWGPDLVVKLRVAGPFSERQIETLHHETGGTYRPDIDRNKRTPLIVNPHNNADIVMVPRPFACRYLWAPMFQAAKRALNVETDESGTVAVRPFLTLACDMHRDDHASGSIAPEVGGSADNPLILTLMFDGFPLEKQSLEHMCLSNASVRDGIALHSEASLRCGLVAGTKETNAGLARLFEMAGVGADLNTIAAGTVCLPCPDGDADRTPVTLHTRLNISADRKALEALRGSGPCSPWCRDCGSAVQHILPWARSAHPPATITEYRQRKTKLVQVVGKDGRKIWKGCARTFFTNAESREAGHVAQQG